MKDLRNHARHLVGIDELSAEEILKILSRARQLRENEENGALAHPLTGVSVITVFFEASTRTRASFEMAAQKLGAQTVSLEASSSSATKGESLWDTGRTLAAMGPGVIVCRHRSAGSGILLAKAVESISDRTVIVNIFKYHLENIMQDSVLR